MNKGKKHFIRNIIISLIALGIVTFILMVAPNYTRNDITNRTNLIINNNNVTSVLKRDIFIDDKGVVYLSKPDIANFFDKYITYDEQYNQIITTSQTKVATLEIGKNSMEVNSTTRKHFIWSNRKRRYLLFATFRNVPSI